MKLKLTIAIVLVVATINVFGQGKPKVDSTNLWWANDKISANTSAIQGSTLGYLNGIFKVKEYKDTVNCLIHIIGKKGFTDAWITARAVVKNGLHNENISTTWNKEYMALATGPFDNTFITDRDLSDCWVIQVAFTEKLTK